MLQVTFTQGNRIDSWLVVVGSQIANLTPGLSFGHNLCLRCLNGQYEPIWNIYTSIAFQWYKELFKARIFDPCNCALKIQESIRDSNSQHGSSLGGVRVHALTLFALPGACEVIAGFPSCFATLPHLALVMSPKLGLQHWTRSCNGEYSSWLSWVTILPHWPMSLLCLRR